MSADAERIQADEIRWLRLQLRGLLLLVVLGALVAILGGPAAVGALQTVQGLVGVTP